MTMYTSENINCTNGESAAAYLYGELGPDESRKFEDHLVACEKCRDDFAAASLARFEVFEWHKLEFAPMETPRFVIPYEPERASWFAEIWEQFAIPRRLLAGAAAATAVVVLMFTIGLFNSTGTDSDLAAADHGPDEAVLVSADGIASETAEIAEPAADEPQIAVNDMAVADPPVSETSATGQNGYGPGQITKRPVRRISREITAVPIQASAPRLNDFDDPSDESLRLAEMFDEIEMIEQ